MTELETQNSKSVPPPALAGGLSAPLKHCPRCEASKPLSAFGIHRARKDGLNLYCKRCIRGKMTESREQRRQWISSHPEGTPIPRRTEIVADARRHALRARLVRTLSHPERIVASLKAFGPQTFKQLRYSARIQVDDLSEALIHVVGHEVISRNGTGPRIYFLKPAPKPIAPLSERLKEPPLSFASIGGIMQPRTCGGISHRLTQIGADKQSVPSASADVSKSQLSQCHKRQEGIDNGDR
jgi:hypothetical protein